VNRAAAKTATERLAAEARRLLAYYDHLRSVQSSMTDILRELPPLDPALGHYRVMHHALSELLTRLFMEAKGHGTGVAFHCLKCQDTGYLRGPESPNFDMVCDACELGRSSP
jgi:hypothetical protein